MSFHGKQPVAPLRHRSSSAVRSNGTSYSNRPRSVGYYGANTTAYSSPYTTTTTNPYSSYNSSYTSNYKSPYFPNGYRSGVTSTGYASLTIPAKTLANINLITPNYSKTYDNNNRDYLKSDAGHRSRRDLGRTGSFNRDRSLSRSRNSLASSGMGSKSVSLTSLSSEGYIVRIAGTVFSFFSSGTSDCRVAMTGPADLVWEVRQILGTKTAKLTTKNCTNRQLQKIQSSKKSWKSQIKTCGTQNKR